jgi:hypothetical protein
MLAQTLSELNNTLAWPSDWFSPGHHPELAASMIHRLLLKHRLMLLTQAGFWKVLVVGKVSSNG